MRGEERARGRVESAAAAASVVAVAVAVAEAEAAAAAAAKGLVEGKLQLPAPHSRHLALVCVTQVSWIRKRDLHILTSMSVTYTSDARFTVVGNPETDDWNLRIDYVQPRDAGIYECQVNTEPKIYRAVALKVLDIQARITGSQELYIRKGSTISLTCIIELQDLPPSNVTWYHAGVVIDFDGPRGGVSLETEKGKLGTTSKLLITRAQLDDSGNYTCASSKVTPASVMVHVLNGEQNTGGNIGKGGSCDEEIAMAHFEILRFAIERASERERRRII
ncbi:uncharacterized protein LOC105204615 isoform X3 [Solenopsis invicta]|uniref:uncharacterized protein LOC105204615 isoform X3 n=1 Tax=Solenopsis invicta TaxID=13686 RepID=UPI00193D0754|nr:uncharacterized protein LOC105204615 isoform X3 [Solenopsis invicta]